MNRRLVVLLALAALASQILLWWVRPAPEPPPVDGPPRSGYSLTDFRLEVLTAAGDAGFSVSAPRLERREGDASLFIETPRFLIPGEDAGDWRGEARRGWVSADGSELRLAGTVLLEADDETRIRTANLAVWPRLRTVETDAATEISQPGRILSGVGLRADLATHSLELLADVQGTLDPSRSP